MNLFHLLRNQGTEYRYLPPQYKYQQINLPGKNICQNSFISFACLREEIILLATEFLRQSYAVSEVHFR